MDFRRRSRFHERRVDRHTLADAIHLNARRSRVSLRISAAGRLHLWRDDMELDVIEVKLAGEFEILVRFKDGVEGIVKFLPTFFRGVFAHLCDQSSFQQVMVVDGVVTWPGELDLAPDAMHDELKRHGQWVLA